MLIPVYILDGKTFIVSGKSSDTIEQIKLRIFQMKGISPKKQKLTFANRQLNDWQTIAEFESRTDFSLNL